MADRIVIKNNFKYRLRPTDAHIVALDGQSAEACRLYNAAVQERRDAYRISHKSINYCDQANQLKDVRAAGDLALANFSCRQDVLRRVDKAFNAFFGRVQNGQKPGYPRLRPVSRYDSVTFTGYGDGCEILDDKLRLQGVGAVKIKPHRLIEGRTKTVTVKREAGKWYAVFSVETKPPCFSWRSSHSYTAHATVVPETRSGRVRRDALNQAVRYKGKHMNTIVAADARSNFCQSVTDRLSSSALTRFNLSSAIPNVRPAKANITT
jgi:transposase